MKPRIQHVFAALLAAGALGSAFAIEPTWRSESELTFASEPVASAATGIKDSEAALVAKVVDALNKDGSLKQTKITVTAENGLILLTGSSPSDVESKKAGQIAASSAGDGNVVNVIQPSQGTYMTLERAQVEKRNQQVLQAAEDKAG